MAVTEVDTLLCFFFLLSCLFITLRISYMIGSSAVIAALFTLLRTFYLQHPSIRGFRSFSFSWKFAIKFGCYGNLKLLQAYMRKKGKKCHLLISHCRYFDKTFIEMLFERCLFPCYLPISLSEPKALCKHGI